MLYHKLLDELNEKRDSVIVDNGPQVEIKAVNLLIIAPEDGPIPKPENMVHAAANNAIYYKFNIQVFGWYNVDVLFRDLPGFENSTLTVQVTGEYKEDINIYLVIPERKVFVPGGPMAVPLFCRKKCLENKNIVNIIYDKMLYPPSIVRL